MTVIAPEGAICAACGLRIEAGTAVVRTGGEFYHSDHYVAIASATKKVDGPDGSWAASFSLTIRIPQDLNYGQTFHALTDEIEELVQRYVDSR